VVILTGLEDDRLVREALHSGARDCLVKGKITAELLARSIRYALARHSEREALRKSEAALERKAEELEEILNVAAHELRHPATVFKDYSYLLLEHSDNLGSEVAREALYNIDRASDRIAHIVNLCPAQSRGAGVRERRRQDIGE
jgi:signal transduction histidine kinase